MLFDKEDDTAIFLEINARRYDYTLQKAYICSAISDSKIVVLSDFETPFERNINSHYASAFNPLNADRERNRESNTKRRKDVIVTAFSLIRT